MPRKSRRSRLAKARLRGLAPLRAGGKFAKSPPTCLVCRAGKDDASYQLELLLGQVIQDFIQECQDNNGEAEAVSAQSVKLTSLTSRLDSQTQTISTVLCCLACHQELLEVSRLLQQLEKLKIKLISKIWTTRKLPPKVTRVARPAPGVESLDSAKTKSGGKGKQNQIKNSSAEIRSSSSGSTSQKPARSDLGHHSVGSTLSSVDLDAVEIKMEPDLDFKMEDVDPDPLWVPEFEMTSNEKADPEFWNDETSGEELRDKPAVAEGEEPDPNAKEIELVDTNANNKKQIQKSAANRPIIKFRKSTSQRSRRLKLITQVLICEKCQHVSTTKVSHAKHTFCCQQNCPCIICGETTGDEEGLKTHMEIKHSDVQSGRGICRVCQKLSKDLQYHYHTEHQTEFTCASCKTEFTNFLEYNQHRRTHPELNLPPVQCDVEECGRIFKGPKALGLHKRTVHYDMPRCKCRWPGCNFGARSTPALEVHINTVHEHNELACKLCSRRFQHTRALRRHMDLHAGQQTHKHICLEPGCGKAFSMTGRLRDHRAAIHGANIRPFICDVCGKDFPIKNYLYIHLRSHETSEEKLARKLKAEQAKEAREERKRAGEQILVPKGRPRIRPIKEKKKNFKSKLQDQQFQLQQQNVDHDQHENGQQFQELLALQP